MLTGGLPLIPACVPESKRVERSRYVRGGFIKASSLRFTRYQIHRARCREATIEDKEMNRRLPNTVIRERKK